jgi:predicted transcriptional regulator
MKMLDKLTMLAYDFVDMKDWTPEEITILRKTYDLSKRKLGELTGVSKNYIYYLEKETEEGKGVRTPSKTLRLVLDCIEKRFKAKENEKGGDEHGKGNL